ncbi:MAG: zinc ribbon domain-containing protein [Proteobacteria bacterium]|nr:zinc ribbon domain-containing protein [Pseudomonadota bacterium]
MSEPNESRAASVCQSCGGVMTNFYEHGTDRSGQRVAEYCRACFRDGVFTEPDVTISQMAQRRTSPPKAPYDPVREDAYAQVLISLAGLDRWKMPDRKVDSNAITRPHAQLCIDGSDQ